MAFEKGYFDQFGADHPGAYWRLTNFSYDNYQQRAELTFSCYVSKEACQSKMQPMTTKTFTLEGADFAMVDALLQSGFKAQVYEFAKTKPEVDGSLFFADAKDV